MSKLTYIFAENADASSYTTRTMPGCGYMDIVDKTPVSAQDFKDLESKGWR